MVRKHEHEPITNTQDKDILKKLMTRRRFLGFAATTTATMVAGLSLVGCGDDSPALGSSTESVNARREEDDLTVSYLEAESVIKSVEVSHPHQGSPWDPERSIGQTPNKLRESAPIPVGVETLTDYGFSEAFIGRMNELINYGWSQANLLEALELGYPVGQKDENGSPLGEGIIYEYDEYIWDHYMSHKIDGLFEHGYHAKTSERLAGWMLKISGYYAKGVIENPFWCGRSSSPFFKVDSVDSEAFSDPGFSRSLVIDFSVTSPTMLSMYEETEYRGQFYVSTNEASDRFEVALQDFSVYEVKS